LHVKDFFDRRAAAYHKVSKWATNESLNERTEEFVGDITGSVAIDLGAGTGILTRRIRHFRTRVALDISAEMLRSIRDSNLKKVLGDVHSLPFAAACADLIIARQVLHYCDLSLAMASIRQVMAPGGYLHVVQIVDIPGVPDHWDQEWASFRGVRNRRHMRTAELETQFARNGLRSTRCEFLDLRDGYAWPAFFEKHNVEDKRQADVKRFFVETPGDIASAIGLQLDEDGISYSRRFGLWLVVST
jgi:SAM-dependent methyltransferase